ncbi:MAG: hypothetical protein AB8G23_14225 [Myxococcota bacterium]
MDRTEMIDGESPESRGMPEAAEEAPAPPPPPASDTRVRALTRILRALGAGVVAASATTFLFQKWDSGDDLTRYFALLAQSGVLAAIGFFCAVRIRESKSARTFMALAAGMIPALFCILGGLVYSQFSMDGSLSRVASYATWRAPSEMSAVLTALATLVAVAPVALFSFLSLARAEAKWLTSIFLLTNAAMLIPSRSPEAMAGLVAAGLGGLGWLELRRWRSEPAMQTREGWVVRAMVLMPLLLIVLRSFVHYELSLYMASVVSFAVAAFLLMLSRSSRRGGAGLSLEGVTIVPAGLGWFCFGVATRESFGLELSSALPLAALPFALSLALLSLWVRDGRPRDYQHASVAIGLISMTGYLLIEGGILAAFLALVTGILAVAYGFFFDRKGLLIVGTVTSALALLHHVHHAIEIYAHLHWGSLSVLGIFVILLAGVIERDHGRLSSGLARLRTRVQSIGADA